MLTSQGIDIDSVLFPLFNMSSGRMQWRTHVLGQVCETKKQDCILQKDCLLTAPDCVLTAFDKRIAFCPYQHAKQGLQENTGNNCSVLGTSQVKFIIVHARLSLHA